MHTLDFTLYLTAAALELGLAGVLIVRKLVRRFPFFLAYLLCSSAGDLIQSWMIRNTRSFYVMHWTLRALYVLLALFTILSIFKSAFRVIYDRFGWLAFALPIGLLLFVDYLFWRTIHHSFGGSFIGIFAADVYSFELGFCCLACSIALFSLWFERHYGFWGRYGLGIVTGFGYLGVFTLLAHLTRLFGGKFETVFQYIPSFGFLGATMLWLLFFRVKEPENTPPDPDPEKLQQILDLFNESVEIAKRMARHLGI